MPKLGITRQGVSLRSVLPDASFFGAEDLLIRSCCGKWNECREGDLFVALVDHDEDGHQHAEQAEANGATGLLTERWVISNLPQCVVPDTRKAYAQICHALAGNPTDYLMTVGITGSHGKSSIAYLLDSILSASGHRVGSFSSLGTTISGRNVNHNAVVWTPPQLSFSLARFVLEDCSHAIVELPSHCLAQYQSEGVDLNVAIISNIRRHHLELHGTVQNYRQVKSRILRQLKDAGLVILNADDPLCHELIDKIEIPCLTYGVMQDANVRGKILETVWGEQTFMISAGDESVVIRSSQIGKHSLDNCLAAATAALALGMTLTDIARGLEQCHVIPGRSQTVQCGQEFGVMIDAAQHADQLAVAFNSGKYSDSGRVICVCTHQESQTPEQRYHLGRIAERGAAQVVITGPGTVQGEIDYEPIHQIMDGMKHPGRAQVVPDRIGAIEWALSQAQPGDTVLITGCGNQPIAAMDHERWQLTDREVCQAWLYGAAQTQNQAKQLEPVNRVFHIDDYR